MSHHLAATRAARPIALLVWLLCGVLSGCIELSPETFAQVDGGAAAYTATALASSRVPLDSSLGSPRALRREGSVIARSPSEAALYIADEDHAAVRRVALPVDGRNKPEVLYLAERPAQVLPLADRTLVTLRDPGALLSVGYRDGKLRILGRAALPDDAWGLAITPDESMALVSSAWTARVSAVALDTMQVLWSIDVAREPRAIVIAQDGRSAYVSHLVGAAVTRIALPSRVGETPTQMRIDLPAAPLRVRRGTPRESSASLGYSATLSPAGDRLFVARHALGVVAWEAWQGVPTVDVLRLPADEPELAVRKGIPMNTGYNHPSNRVAITQDHFRDEAGQLLLGPIPQFIQPRAMVYRASSDTVLVASEGNNLMVELDALATDVGTAPLRTYDLGAGYDLPQGEPEEGRVHVASVCSAPSGIALSEDDNTAFVFCRGSYDLAMVSLSEPAGPIPSIRLAADPLNAEAALGRRMFYDAEDRMISGGMGCAGCHPEGRDDGFVWSEVSRFGDGVMLVSSNEVFNTTFNGHLPPALPRHTPMLAGRLQAPGPYGVHGGSATLERRVREGFELHRWASREATTLAALKGRSRRIAAFLRQGLVSPPVHKAPLSEQQQRGKELFHSRRAQCSQCHQPNHDYGMPDTAELSWLPPQPGLERDTQTTLKVPSLRFLAGSAPYLHDGSAATLEELLLQNRDRMGHTSQLSDRDRRALIDFMETL